MCRAAALFLDAQEEQIQFDGSQFVDLSTGTSMSRKELADQGMSGSPGVLRGDCHAQFSSVASAVYGRNGGD